MRLGGRLTPGRPSQPPGGEGLPAECRLPALSTIGAEPADPAGPCQRQSAHLQVLRGVHGPVLVFAVRNTVVNNDRFRIC